MSSRILLNLGMLLALVVLLWVTYLSVQEVPEVELPRLSNLQTENISQLRLVRGDEVLLFEQRGDKGWFMKQPIEAVADPVLISRMLASFGLQSQERYPAIGLNLKKYGLDEPRVTLVADEFALAFGRINPLNSLRYVRTETELHMVAENNISFLEQDWEKFLARTLLPEYAQIKSLQIEGLGRLLRSDEGWRYQGSATPESVDQLQVLVDRWRVAQALTVTQLSGPVREKLAGVSVVVELAEGEMIEFVVSKQAGDWLLFRPDLALVYTMSDMEPLLGWSSLPEVE